MKRKRRPGRGPLPEPPAAVQEALAEALAPFGPRPPRDQALPILQAVQRRVAWLSPEVLAFVSRRTGLPVAHLSSLAGFYDLLAAEPRGRQVVRVCDDIACRLGGRSQEALDFLSGVLGIRPGETTADGRYTLETCSCLGYCDQPAAVRADTGLRQALQPRTHHGWLPGYEPVLLRRSGRVDPESLADYLAHGGMAGLRRALELGPAGTIAAVKASGLVGRGGAAFPTGVKWEAAAREQADQKYVVLNADESEPGTFTNRKLLEDDPFSVLEGMIIAGYAVGASRGYAYIRGEYDLAAARFAAAVAAARAAGYLGPDVLGSGFAFDVEIRRGAGAYVCGEETALFASIEGYRGEPRNKPPFPTRAGLFGRPTVINNGETLACVPALLTIGPAAFAAAPPKLFSVSGRVARPGVYEAPLGTPLDRLLAEGAGGIEGELQAVLIGAPPGCSCARSSWRCPWTLAPSRRPAQPWVPAPSWSLTRRMTSGRWRGG